MVEGGRRGSLAPQPLSGQRVHLASGVDALDGDMPLEAIVKGEYHRAHAARTESTKNLVDADVRLCGRTRSAHTFAGAWRRLTLRGTGGSRNCRSDWRVLRVGHGPP